MMKNIQRFVFFLLAFFLLSYVSFAQDVVEVKGNVKLMNHMDNKVEELKNSEEVFFGMGSLEQMTEAKKKIEEIRMGPGAEYQKEDKVKKIRLQYKITSKTRGPKKSFKKEVPSDFALLFVTGIDCRTSDVITINPNQKEYIVEIRIERLGEAIGKGQASKVSIKGGGGADADDGNERFKINLHLLPGEVRSDTRMIVQLYMVDCASEDTLKNCETLVFEGSKYHSLQRKRMSYDYQNDPLAPYYHNSVELRDSMPFDFDTIVVVPKPDKKRSYKGPYDCIIEDYLHICEDGGFAGQCLKPRPFKLLDFSPALANLKLTDEFYEPAETKVNDKQQDLQLLFETGTAVLKSAPSNIEQKEKLENELKSYGSSLSKATIVGGASPDGSRSTNEKLAKMRAETARGLFSGIKLDVSTKVYSWNDVINELNRRGCAAEVEAMNAVLASGRTDDISLTHAMQAIPTYKEVIEPVLALFRVMKCKYRVVVDRAMTAEECIEEFHKYKQQYKEGKKHFSGGDFYNLFNNIKDSLELDELTYIAYRDITSEEEYYNYSPMAPYVCNRMALLNLKRGVANSSVLDPFIDYSKRKIGAKKGVGDNVITINRREICINQAVTYYQLQQMDSARHLIGLVEASGIKDKNLEMLKHFMKMKELHFKDRNAEEQEEYLKAKDIVLSVSDENKAILYTEIDEWDMRDQAHGWVDMMDNMNPKKWYLKGILAADQLLNKKDKAANSSGSGSGGSDVDAADNDASDDSVADGAPANESSNIGDDCYPRVNPADEQMLMFDKSEDYYKKYMEAKQHYMDTHNGQLPKVGECLAGTAVESLVTDSTATDVSKEQTLPNVDVLGEGIPDYLAYFHHAFKLEKSYKKFYAAEGHVPETLRKKHKYLKKDFPAYESLFESLKVNDDAAHRKALRMKKTSKVVSNDDPWATGNNEENTTNEENGSNSSKEAVKDSKSE